MEDVCDICLQQEVQKSERLYSRPVNRLSEILLGDNTAIRILYEDHGAIAIDKPAGWIVAPEQWTRTSRNLQRALSSAVAAREPWAYSRHIRYIRFVHRLDAETSGVLLLAKSPGTLRAYSEIFRQRAMDKVYLAVVKGEPGRAEWTCTHKLAPDPAHRGKMLVDERRGQQAETRFALIGHRNCRSLIEARPATGRTHQVRVHLAVSGFPVVGDSLYSSGPASDRREPFPLGLRALVLQYTDPFRHRAVRICAPSSAFLAHFGFEHDLDPSILQSLAGIL